MTSAKKGEIGARGEPAHLCDVGQVVADHKRVFHLCELVTWCDSHRHRLARNHPLTTMIASSQVSREWLHTEDVFIQQEN